MVIFYSIKNTKLSFNEDDYIYVPIGSSLNAVIDDLEEKFNLDITYVTSSDFYQSNNVGLDLSTRLKQQIVSSVNYNKTWPYKKNTLNIYLSEVYDLMNDNDADLHIINDSEINSNIFIN